MGSPTSVTTPLTTLATTTSDSIKAGGAARDQERHVHRHVQRLLGLGHHLSGLSGGHIAGRGRTVEAVQHLRSRAPGRRRFVIQGHYPGSADPGD
jgi:hypothetical protein